MKMLKVPKSAHNTGWGRGSGGRRDAHGTSRGPSSTVSGGAEGGRGNRKRKQTIKHENEPTGWMVCAGAARLGGEFHDRQKKPAHQLSRGCCGVNVVL